MGPHVIWRATCRMHPKGTSFGAHPKGTSFGAHPKGTSFGAHPKGTSFGAHPKGTSFGAHPKGTSFGAHESRAAQGCARAAPERWIDRQLRCLAFGVCRPTPSYSGQIALGRSSPLRGAPQGHFLRAPAASKTLPRFFEQQLSSSSGTPKMKKGPRWGPFVIWRARRDSNSRPPGSKPVRLTPISPSKSESYDPPLSHRIADLRQ